MNIQDLQRHVTQEKLSPLYAILGDESYFRDRALKILQRVHEEGNDRKESARENSSRESPSLFESDVVYGDETNASEILELAEEVSFFSSRRRVFVKWADKLSARDGEALIPYIQQPNKATTLVFAAAKLDGRTKWVQTLKKHALVVDCGPMPESQRAGWIMHQVRALGLQIEPQALEILKEQASEGLYVVLRELEKLADYVSSGQRVKMSDVECVRGRPPGISVFDWAEAVSYGDHGRALDIVAKNLETGEAPLRMLGAFLWQVRRMWKVSGLLREGKDQGTGRSTSWNSPISSTPVSTARTTMAGVAFSKSLGSVCSSRFSAKGRESDATTDNFRRSGRSIVSRKEGSRCLVPTW